MHVHNHLFRYDSYAALAILSIHFSPSFHFQSLALLLLHCFFHSFYPLIAYSLKLIVAEWNLVITSRAVKLGSDWLFHQSSFI